ncbi:ClpP/crotonase-like domain-containing protein [Phycomyces blakesleeanus]|uniref:3-hydroxyisobutyryl-CoA hydrolase n=1 Tax=Phycomyces blakesleeanus TaxID=4837 RepID=A0ABR3AYQ1_PHYBL
MSLFAKNNTETINTFDTENLQDKSSDAPKDHIISRKVKSSRHIILNQPEILNAIGFLEVQYLKHFIKAAENSPSVNTVIVKGTGRAFSSGGDVLSLYKSIYIPNNIHGYKKAWDIWNIIASMKKPYVAIMDGFSIGTGAGLAAHGSFRVATEKTVFSMPEAAFGFVSDAGSSFFLNQLDNMIGTYIALTAQYLKGADVFFSGIATHYVPSHRLGAMEYRISQLDVVDHDEVDSIIEEFSADPGTQYRHTLKGNVVKTIKNCFKYNTVEEILEALDKDGSDFALKTKTEMLKLSPTSLKANLELIRRASKSSFASCMESESRAAMNKLLCPDFKEGVDARFVKHTQPRWNPSTLNAVDIDYVRSEILDKQNVYTAKIFHENAFHAYPYWKYGLPSDKDVQKIIQNPETAFYNYYQVVSYFLQKSNYKFGVLEKVIDILDRNTRSGDKSLAGKIEWIE